MSNSGQFDKVYSDQDSLDKCATTARDKSKQKGGEYVNGKIIVLVTCSMLFSASITCLYDSLRDLDSKTSECKMLNSMGRVASSLVVETASSIGGILAAVICLFTLIYPIVESLEGEDCYNVNSFGSLNNIDDSKKSQTASRFTFASHLTTTLSAFGSLMTITTCTLRLLNIWMNDSSDSDLGKADPDVTQILCMLRQSLRLVVALIILACDMVLICIINKVMQSKIRSSRVHVAKYEDDLEDFLRRFHHNDWINGYPSKPIPIICSFLIVSGGLSVLGCIMGRLSIPRFIQDDNIGLEDKLRYSNLIEISTWGGLPSGILAMLSGVVAVTAVHCCTAPMWQLEDEAYTNHSYISNHGCYHIIAVCLCVVTIAASGCSYYTEGVYLMDRAYILTSKGDLSTDNDLQNVLLVKSALVLFSSMLHMLFSFPLLACLATDLQVRLQLKRANYLWKIIEKFKESASMSAKEFEQSIQQKATAFESISQQVLPESNEMQISTHGPMDMFTGTSNTASQWSGNQQGFRLPSAADALVDSNINMGGSKTLQKRHSEKQYNNSNKIMGLPPYDSVHNSELIVANAAYMNDLPFFQPKESSPKIRRSSTQRNEGSSSGVKSEILVRRSINGPSSSVNENTISHGKMKSYYGRESATFDNFNMTSV